MLLLLLLLLLLLDISVLASPAVFVIWRRVGSYPYAPQPTHMPTRHSQGHIPVLGGVGLDQQQWLSPVAAGHRSRQLHQQGLAGEGRGGGGRHLGAGGYNSQSVSQSVSQPARTDGWGLQ
jgi:hypothetical protein